MKKAASKKAGARTIRVDVTWEDIARGKKGEATSCPIARALDRAGVAGAEVGGFEVDFTDPWGESAKMPKRASAFVEAFDDDRTSVRPFSFSLRLPKGVKVKQSRGAR